MSSLQLCNLITDSDKEMFCKLCKRDIIDHSERIDNERVTKVGVQWGKLCRVVQECVIVNRQQGYFIGKLTEV